jgi:hypothetical protein
LLNNPFFIIHDKEGGNVHLIHIYFPLKIFHINVFFVAAVGGWNFWNSVGDLPFIEVNDTEYYGTQKTGQNIGPASVMIGIVIIK